MSDPAPNPAVRAVRAVCAVAASAKTIMPMADMFWGDRFGVIKDPFGHRWSNATPNGSPVMGQELNATMNKAIQGAPQ